jgi:ribosomal protein S18 acetylase RimI-like enzyme
MAQPRGASLSYVIVPAGPADAEAMARIHVAAWRETYRGLLPDALLARMSEKGWARRFRRELTQPHPNAVTLLAANPFGPFGYVIGGPARARSGETGAAGEAEIALLYLQRAGQGHGAGKRLLQSAARALAAQGAASLVVAVLRDNLPARGFYEHLGGVADLAREEPGPGGRQWEVRYRWADIRKVLKR